MEHEGEVLAIIAGFAGLGLADLRETKKELSLATDEKEYAHQEALDRLHAVLFFCQFPDLVRKGVLDRIICEQEFEAETDGFARCERKQFLNTFRGKIIVYRLMSSFQGRSNDDAYEPPRWVTYAIEMLAHQGWQVSIKTDVFAEVGIGNHLNAYLIIEDPRPVKLFG